MNSIQLHQVCQFYSKLPILVIVPAAKMDGTGVSPCLFNATFLFHNQYILRLNITVDVILHVEFSHIIEDSISTNTHNIL